MKIELMNVKNELELVIKCMDESINDRVNKSKRKELRYE